MERRKAEDEFLSSRVTGQWSSVLYAVLHVVTTVNLVNTTQLYN